jgi:S-DNA-T family DNA segregation ATPase FtsK/SpoIIIE
VPVTIDLAADGPHALVAGTSGSGKSEFLRALMLAEAVTTPPDRLAIVGLDHKGGATFRDLENLPHVVGVATDLDAAGTARVLSSLEAELAARERLLERHGVAAWRDLDQADRPARLLVIVDEFRTLLDALPEAQARLERLAAQGRSLGMGLVAATQRPAGAVSAQLRANLALRICFRVAGEADSMDVVGNASAAQIDPAAPGTCVLATAGREPTALRVRLVPPPPRRPARPARWPDHWGDPPPAPPDVGALVEAVAAAAAAAGAAPPPAPWRPPLPRRLELADLVGFAPAHARPPHVLLGLADLPEAQTQVPLTWDTATGHLAILGGPRSGRTTGALTAAAGLAAAGWPTHVITHEPAAFAALAGLPTLGAVVEAGDADGIAELLATLRAGRHALVADAAAELEGLATAGASRPLLEALTQGSLAPGAVLALTGPPKASRWLAACPHRLILATPGAVDDLALGVPRDMAGARHIPGRACYLGGGSAWLVQLAVPGAIGAVGQLATGPPPVKPPALVLPLPRRVSPEDLPPTSPGGPVWIGLGGAYATPVALTLEPGRPVAIVGPHGSGRSTALLRLHERLQSAAWPVHFTTPAQGATWHEVLSALTAGAVALVDDLETMPPPAPPVLPATGTLIASYTTAAAAAFRPPTQLFHAHPRGVVLWSGQAGSSAVFGPGRLGLPAVELVGPRRAEPPGRGRMVVGGQSYPVQLSA